MEEMSLEKKTPVLKRLFVYAGNHKYFTILGMALSGISAIISLLPILFIWNAVREIFATYPNVTMSDTIVQNAWLAVISTLASMFIYFAGLMCTHVAAFRIAKNMRFAAISHLMKLPLGYFNKTGSGKLRRVINDSAAQTETFLAHQLPDLVGAMVTPIAVLCLLFVFDWRIGLISLIPTALGMLTMMKMMGPGFSDRMKQYQDALANMSNEAVEYVRGVPVVKTFGQSVYSFEKFYNTIRDYETFVLKYTLLQRMPMTVFQSFTHSMPLFLSVGGILLISGASDPKNFLLNFFFYVLFTPICSSMMMKIMWTSQNIMLCTDALDRVDELLTEEPLVQTKNAKKPNHYDIVLNNISFHYPTVETNAISDVSFRIPKGSTVALVGPSGGGKSTLAMLIARFYDVQSGSITIGDVDIRDMEESELMKNISFVFQNTNLYKASLLDNIKEGKPDATLDEVMVAVKAARCEDIIAKFPQGIDTVVGTKGIYLSGGESQRISLARAILKDAPIILLDEATAFTDPENEHLIQLAFAELAKDKTVLMIAHRLTTIQNADQIYLIADGGINEHGTHKELLAQNGQYKSMWDEYQSAFMWKESEGIA